MSQSALFYVVLFAAMAVAVNGYIFTCLDGCECDTDDEAIHCHNNVSREALHLPATRLRGYTIIGLTRNNIRQLPSQEVLKLKFPDLKAIDVEGNPKFNCSSLDYYTRVVVMSDCGKSADELANTTFGVEEETDGECDFVCKRERHLKALQEYLLKLWKLLKVKLAELKAENRWMQDVEDFFNEWSAKIGDTLKSLTDESGERSASAESVANLFGGNLTEASKHVHLGNAVGRRHYKVLKRQPELEEEDE